MRKSLIEIGKKYGRWTIIREGGRVSGRRGVVCSCECGTERTICLSSLVGGNSTSCGCFVVDANKRRSKPGRRRKDGKTAGAYRAWLGLKNRCLVKTNPYYKNYGGRGIKVCDRWRDSFEAFFEDMGERPEGKSIDRIDNDGHYEPSNCRWATVEQQALNRRSNVLITAFGESHPLIIWCKRFDLKYTTVRARIVEYGWSPEDALTMPIAPGRKIRQS